MYTRILVPLDGSKLAECSLEHIRNLTQVSMASEVVLFIVQEDMLPVPLTEPANLTMAQENAKRAQAVKKQIELENEKYLTRVAESLRKEGILVKTLILSDPLKTIPEIIMDYAESSKADLIVMSTHGRTGIKRWAFGSVTDKVVNYSKIPVLIVPPALCRV